MVGIVLISHSIGLAEGAAELVAEIAGGVRVIAAGGTDDGRLGTSTDRISSAIQAADAGDGVVLIPDLGNAFKVRLVYVLRPLTDIEATRQRRNWPLHLGAAAAKVIYDSMFAVLVERAFPTILLRYREILAEPLRATEMLARFAGLDVAPSRIKQAAAFVRHPSSNASPSSGVESPPE